MADTLGIKGPSTGYAFLTEPLDETEEVEVENDEVLVYWNRVLFNVGVNISSCYLSILEESLKLGLMYHNFYMIEVLVGILSLSSLKDTEGSLTLKLGFACDLWWFRCRVEAVVATL